MTPEKRGSPRVRNITVQDVQQVMLVQVRAYPPELHEEAGSFLDKIAHFPRGALGTFEGGSLTAYLFCFPWTLGEPFPLNASRFPLPAAPDCLYIHDLAVDPGVRGKGAARALVEEAILIGREEGLEDLALVAVQGSEPFWEAFGFEAVRRIDYRPGVQASYMVKKARR